MVQEFAMKQKVWDMVWERIVSQEIARIVSYTSKSLTNDGLIFSLKEMEEN